jgi:hypothetical protein
MKIKKFFGLFILIFVILFMFLIQGVVLANTCTGSVSYTYPTYSCVDEPFLGYKVCDGPSFVSATGNCHFNSIGQCGYCRENGYDCQDPPASACYVEHLPGGCGTSSYARWELCGSGNLCVTVNGKCGGSNGDSFCSRPTTGLCSSGKLSWTDSVGSDGKWNWKCVGTCSDSTDASCSATNLPTVNASCGSAETDSSCTAPTTNLCSSGTASSVTTNATTFTWTCTGSCGGTNDSCTKTRSIIDGECGSADGGNFASTPTSGLCSVGTTSTVKVNPITYTWTCDRKCNGSIDSCLATRDIAPTFPVPTVPTSPGATDPISNPSGGVRLHNCQFPDASQMTIKVAVSDANGLDDIGNIYLRFSGQSTEYGPVSPVSGVATFNLDITSVPNGVYTVQAKADDVHSPISSGWVNLSYQFKKWDCLVNVSGTFYDGSNAPILCATGLGYTTPIPSGLNFDLRYQIGTGAPRVMTVNSPNFSSDTDNRLYWNSAVDYQPLLINFPGTNPTQAKINNDCYNTAALDPKIADPYATNPSLSIQYSSILDQEAWYRTSGGSIMTKGTPTNYVPGTCTTVNCRTVINDIILSTNQASLSPYDKTEVDNLVYDNQTVSLKPYSYDSLKRQYLSTKGYGTTVPDSATWSEIPTKSGVIFVNGNLTIDTNIATTSLVMIVAKGNITINSDVTRIDGILMGNSVIASDKSDKQLVINGSIYGIQSVVLNRSLEPKNLNNKTPAVEVRYNPSLIFKLDPKMIQTITQWRLLQ